MLLFLQLACIGIALTQDKYVDFSTPFYMDANHTNILDIQRDANQNVMVSLENNEARIYSYLFSTYESFTMPQPADRIHFLFRTYFNLPISTGGTTTIKAQAVVTLSNNFTTLRTYEYPGFNLLQTYHLSDRIITYQGFPTKDPSGYIQVLHVLYCESSLFLAFNGTVTPVSYYKSGEQNLATIENVVVYGLYASMQSYFYKFNMDHYQSNQKIYQGQITFYFKWSPTTEKFTYAGYDNLTMTYLYSPSIVCHSLFRANDLFITQNTITGQIALYDLTNNVFASTQGLMTSLIRNFLTINGAYFILQQNGFAKFTYDTMTYTLALELTVHSLSKNLYNLQSLSYLINLFWTVKGPVVYLLQQCSTQTLWSGLECVYPCADPFCAYCRFSANTCSQCIANYTLTGNSTCIEDISYGPSANSSTVKPSVFFMFVSQELWDFLMALLQQLLSGLKAVISVPGARRAVSPVFCFFGVFDDLYLFQFHDRVYGTTMKAVFTEIQEIQNSKWGIVSYRKTLQLIGSDSEKVDALLNYQEPYVVPHWSDPDHQDTGTEALFPNSQDFFFVSIPLVLVGFLVGRAVFKLLFAYPASRLFRKFDFWVFLPFLLFEGNVEQFAFFTTRDLMTLFGFGLSHKLLKTAVVLFGLTVILYSCAVYILSFIAYRRLNSYFTDNNRNKLTSITFLTFQNGVKNILLGSLQALLRCTMSYHLLILTLVGVELLFLIPFVLAIRFAIYRRQVKIWVYLILCFIKMLLVLTFLLDYQNTNLPTFEIAHQLFMFLLICLFTLGLSFEAVEQLIELKQMITRLFLKKCLNQNMASSKREIDKSLSFERVDKKPASINVSKKTNHENKKVVLSTNEKPQIKKSAFQQKKYSALKNSNITHKSKIKRILTYNRNTDTITVSEVMKRGPSEEN